MNAESGDDTVYDENIEMTTSPMFSDPESNLQALESEITKAADGFEGSVHSSRPTEKCDAIIDKEDFDDDKLVEIFMKINNEAKSQRMRARRTLNARNLLYDGPKNSRDILYDTASFSVNYDIVLKQFAIHLFMIPLKMFPCVTNWGNQQLNFLQLFKTRRYTLVFTSFVSPIYISVLILLDIWFLTDVSDDPHGIEKPIHLIYIPFISYLLHRLAIGLKYGTLSRTEYDRFMIADGETADRYMQNIQLLSGWNSQRPKALLLFEAQSAAMRVQCSTKEVYFTLEDPGKSSRAKLEFMQWQALLLRRENLLGLSENLHPDLTGHLHQLSSGHYRVSVHSTLLAILDWIEEPELIEKDGKNVPSGVDKFKEMTPFNTLFILFSFVIFIIPFVSTVPAMFGSEMRFEGKCSFALNIITQLMGFPFYFANMQFYICLMRDTQRRIMEAQILAEMMRTKDTITEYSLTNLARDPTSRNIFEDFSKIDNEMFTAGNAAFAFGFRKIHEHHLYAARVPRVSWTASGQGNMVAWLYLRSTFRSFGVRQKQRMDIIVLVSFLILVMIVFGHTFVYIGQLMKEDEYSYFFTVFSTQLVLMGLQVLIYTSGNFYFGAKANEFYSEHRALLGSIELQIELRFSKLANSKLLNAAQEAKLQALRSFKSCINRTMRAIDTTDEHLSITFGGVPATFQVLTALLTAVGTIVVSTLGFITRLKSSKDAEIGMEA